MLSLGLSAMFAKYIFPQSSRMYAIYIYLTMSYICVGIWRCYSQRHLVEIERLTQDRDKAHKELEAARTQINELQNLGKEMISKHNHQVALLEGTSVHKFLPVSLVPF